MPCMKDILHAKLWVPAHHETCRGEMRRRSFKEHSREDNRVATQDGVGGAILG